MARDAGVVGGGLLGCLVALHLARRGWRVTIFERRNRLLDAASRRNEGKVHLGYTYGLDRSGATRQLLFGHGSRFEPLLVELLGSAASETILGRRQHYVVHRGSLLGPDGVAAHMEAIAALHEEPAGAVRKLSERELRSRYGDAITAAYDVDESSADCVGLCELVAAAIASTRVVRVVTGVAVGSVEDGARPEIHNVAGESLGRFDVAVNAAWDGMPAIERKARAMAHPLCLRGKAGFVTTLTAGSFEQAITVVYGPYGDVVPLRHGTVYLSWYPAALMGLTTDVSQGADWFDRIEQTFDFAACYRQSCVALADLVPGVAFAEEPLETRAGAILAAGESDISDPGSRLHQRTLIGVYRRGNVFAVDTGKLTSAPALAADLAALIAG